MAYRQNRPAWPAAFLEICVKDRLVPLPDQTLVGLRELWKRHRHSTLIFPNANGSFETIRQAKTHMDRGGTQKTMKAANG